MDAAQIVENMLRIMQSGWNNANGDEFAKPFAGKSQFTDIRGTFYQDASQQDLAGAHHGLFMSLYKGTRVTYKLIRASQIDQNTILANASAAMENAPAALQGANSSSITMVLNHIDGEWKIVAFHNTLVIQK